MSSVDFSLENIDSIRNTPKNADIYQGKDNVCLSQCSTAMKRYHDQGNSHKRKNLIAGLLLVSESLLSWQHGSTASLMVLE